MNRKISILFILILLICFSLFIYIYNLYRISWHEQEMERHASVIEEDYWALDNQGPLKYLTLVSERENFGSIAIFGLNGEEFLSIKGPSLNSFDLFLENMGLISRINMEFDISYNGEKIGILKGIYRNKNIYMYFYVLVFIVLFYFVVILFIKTVDAKHQLESRVRKRTFELEEEIEERKKIETELKNARNYISNIIDSMPSVLVGVDAQIKVTQWNRTAESVTKITAAEAKGKLLAELLPQMEGKLEYIKNSIHSGKINQEQKIVRKHKDGIYYDDITIYPLIEDGFEGAVIRIDDVTEKVRLEEMMIQSEKMLSVGGLAAGMAHEINNPLGGMMQTASVMENRLGKNLDIPSNISAALEAGTTIESIKKFMDSRGIPRMIRSINESGRRVSDIINNMLSFSRKSEGQTSTQSLELLIDKTLELASTDYDLKKQYDFKAVQIVKEYERNLPAVPCERAKIQQVLLNILRNGAQAMQESGTENPVFIIRTKLDRENNMVSMEIEDNGPGMDEVIRKRVFEPFFTTKEVGVGTGLGLSVSYFIITENHNGKMEVESQKGDGAKFIIKLPIE